MTSLRGSPNRSSRGALRQLLMGYVPPLTSEGVDTRLPSNLIIPILHVAHQRPILVNRDIIVAVHVARRPPAHNLPKCEKRGVA